MRQLEQPQSVESALSAQARGVSVDFVRGADVCAPGLTRAQAPLMQALTLTGYCRVRERTFAHREGYLLFPYLYGPLALQVAASRADVVHIASSWYAHAARLAHRPVVLTCHDFLDVPGPGDRTLKPHRRFHIEACLAGFDHAAAIVCDSHAVRQQLVALKPHVADRARVVPLGVSSRFAPGPPSLPTLRRLGLRMPFVLYVGSEQQRKNVPAMLDAFSRALQAIPDLQFVKVGEPQTAQGRAEVRAVVADLGLSASVRILDRVSDDELIDLYRSSVATLLLSRHEGFGFPALEAMSCGCPVIASSIDSLPEVVGSDIPTYDPDDIEGVAAQIVRLASDVDYRDLIADRGLKRAELFSWHEAAMRHLEIYRSVMPAA